VSITTWGWGTHGTISTWGWGGWWIIPPSPPIPTLPPFECSRISLLEKATNKMLEFAARDGVPKNCCESDPIMRYQDQIIDLCRRISALEIHLMALVDESTDLYQEVERLGLVIDPLTVIDCFMMGDGQDPSKKKN